MIDIHQKKHRMVIYLFMVLLLIMISGYCWIVPLYNELERQRTDNQQYLHDYSVLNKQTKQLPQLSQQMRAQQEILALYKPLDQPALLKIIIDMAEHASLKVVSVSPEEQQENELLVLKLQGAFIDLVDFFNRLSHSTTGFRVQQLSIQADHQHSLLLADVILLRSKEETRGNNES